MPRSIQKLGIPLGIALLLDLACYVTHPLPLRAQEQGTYTPPSCTGNPARGPVKCNYQNGDNYIGSLANGLPNGRGTYVYASSKDRYEGDWRNGRPNGRGVYIFGNDARYEGIFRDGTIVNGKAIFADGNRYEGPFEIVENIQSGAISSQPSGRGRFFFANGDRYEGDFFAGVIFGTGTVRRTDGTRCQGQFFNNALDGRGTCNYPNRDRYEGELRGAIPHGKGVLIQANGRRYQGEFRAGQPFDPRSTANR